MKHDDGFFAPEVENETPTVSDDLLFGTVSDCSKLNIRKAPSKLADVVAEVLVDTEVMIDTENSTDEWYCVCTSSGIEGFCMKQYITLLP